MARTSRKREGRSGRLRIGDDWNAITIIALSQSNPLKAVAEFVENSVDAGARHIVITRGREGGEHYLSVRDDGQGIPQDAQGVPDFRYVATHICDSVKRRLKADGAQGIQGEFGIGLLSFWTVGETLTMTSAGTDGKTYQMVMRKGDPGYHMTQRRSLFPDRGTELKIRPLLPGIRQLSGDKIQWYLAAELRDRIRRSGVRIEVIDRSARKQYVVEPREFTGRLLHLSPETDEVYLELYLAQPDSDNKVALCRSGTRVLEDIGRLDAFNRDPWSSGYLQGIVDAPFVNLTPGTRTGVIHDDDYARLDALLAPVGAQLERIIQEQRTAEEERASERILRSIQNAFKEALLALPPEEYDWFDIGAAGSGRSAKNNTGPAGAPVTEAGDGEEAPGTQKQFFEYAGPLFSVRVSPASCVLPVGNTRTLRALARDRSRLIVEHEVDLHWEIVDGAGVIDDPAAEIITFHAPEEPALVRLRVTATQGTIACAGEGLITVTDSLLPETVGDRLSARRGLPDYTFKWAPGELWRSRFDVDRNVVVVNSGHRDFAYASRNKALKLRYMCRLFAKELVLSNFPGQAPAQLLERMIELSLYTEEHLR